MFGESIAESVKLLLSITDKLMDRLPDYNQNKKELFYTLRKRYLVERSKEYPQRDDNLIGICRMDLMEFLKTFEQEIESEIREIKK
jgi:hypothetical protein